MKETNTILLSVIIPVYNAEEYLEKCLEPLISTGGDVQIILSDDGSTDSSFEICKEYANNKSNVELISGPNGGPSVARNRALERIRGEYVVFCDSDDWLDDGMIERLRSIIEISPVDLVHFGVTTESVDKTEKMKMLYSKSHYMSQQEIKELFALICGYRDNRKLPFDSYGLVTCKIFRAEILKGLRFDPDIVGEDTLYAMQAVCRVKTAYWDADDYYHYRIVQGSYSRRHFPEIVPMAVKMLQSMHEVLDIEGTDNNMIKEAYYNHCFGKMRWCIEATVLKNEDDRTTVIKKVRYICNIPEFSETLKNISIVRLPKRSKVLAVLLKMKLYYCAAKCLKTA